MKLRQKPLRFPVRECVESPNVVRAALLQFQGQFTKIQELQEYFYGLSSVNRQIKQLSKEDDDDQCSYVGIGSSFSTCSGLRSVSHMIVFVPSLKWAEQYLTTPAGSRSSSW